MTFRRPFKSYPIKLRPVYMAQLRRKRQRRVIFTALACLGLFCFVFLGGMLITNWGVFTGNSIFGASGRESFGHCGMVRRNCVVDGDTFWLQGEKVRIANIDAPETPGSERCRHFRGGKNPSWCDFDRGLMARQALGEFLSSGDVVISRVGEDRYGRTLAIVSVGGRDAGARLIDLGLARPWQD